MIRGRRNTEAVLRVVGAAVLFSTGGAAIKSAAFSAMQVASIRSGIAAAMLLVWFRHRARWSRQAIPIGIVYAATLLLFVAATKLTTAAGAIFLQSAAPLYVALLGPVLLGERWQSRDFGVLVGMAVGLALCLAGAADPTVTAPDPWMGNLLGAACGITWALTLVGLRWGARAHPNIAVSAVVSGNVFAFLVGVPALWPLPAASAVEWGTLAYLGLFQIGFAYILLAGAIAVLPAVQVSLLLLLEPALNPLWAWLVRGEVPGTAALVGGMIIVAVSGIKAFMDAAGEEA
jgi:drug/metabolite transporter (DMT)-like permease